MACIAARWLTPQRGGHVYEPRKFPGAMKTIPEPQDCDLGPGVPCSSAEVC